MSGSAASSGSHEDALSAAVFNTEEQSVGDAASILSSNTSISIEEHAVISTAEKVDEAVVDVNTVNVPDTEIMPAQVFAHDTEELASIVPAAMITDEPAQEAELDAAVPLVAFDAGDSGVKGDAELQERPSTPLSPHQKRQILRYVRRNQRVRRRPSLLASLSMVFMGILLFGVLAPLALTASYAIRVYATYDALRSHASSGVQHLLAIKTVFASQNTLSGGITRATTSNSSAHLLDINKLTRVDEELSAARNDFVQVKTLIDQTLLLQLVRQYVPQYSQQVISARAASQIGIDVTDIGHELVGVGKKLAPRLQGPLLGGSTTPLLMPQDLFLLETTLTTMMPSVNDIQAQSQSLSLSSLPLSAHERALAQQYLPLLPKAVAALNMAQGLMGSMGWLLGVGQPRTFLVETMDRAELRATGGFTGQYGELHINGGRVAPFSLTNVALVEYADNSPAYGNIAPAPYRSWWPFANWGLRDANLSADFPTSAQLVMDRYQTELKQPVDGVIMFTPFMIEDVLRAIGPVQVPRYNETITAQNLEERLHYYQLDNAGIRKEELVENINDPEQARKQFTSALAHTLIDRAHTLGSGELLALASQMLQDLHTRDLQVYLSNPQLESLLMQYGDAGQMDRSMTHDGWYLVQTNVSASKASQYVQTMVSDTVSLNASGGATHVLHMQLVYKQAGPVYGLDTYRDYVRVYMPPTAHLLSGDGFDSGQPLCGGPLQSCPDTDVYSQNELVCPSGQYQSGYTAPMLNDPYAGGLHPLDKVGSPDNLVSDEPGRGMFGGYVVIPKDCTANISLSWYVPPMSAGPYNLLIQRQASVYPELNLAIVPAPRSNLCSVPASAGLYFNGILTQDVSFSLKPVQSVQDVQAGCQH